MLLEAIPQRIWDKMRRGMLIYLAAITASGLLLWHLQIRPLTIAWQLAFWVPIGLMALVLAFDLMLAAAFSLAAFCRDHVKHRYLGTVAAAFGMLMFVPMGMESSARGILAWLGIIAAAVVIAWFSDYLPLERHGGRIAADYISRLESRR